VARVVALVPDLLFGSRLVSALGEAGHEVELVSSADDVRARVGAADVLVVDLTADAAAGIALVGELRPAARTLGFYSHVEADVRRAAEEKGYDLVVPRSRMHREGPKLVESLL